ncbi:hypothetical protein JM83_1792 [Gillisia sp. Hel_I_86]|uniref:hypothetical protein n=1 Tax=Gillisia sp. Hel_I_86 TaxID=1249981 RepID=UPI001198E65D|nr:hypothetical protein [Gillisia sp. Hel_I_86]TVZ26802.1 hypothetical protein JM83_1792 [Gillisia sp. Hel_I_86]
MGKYFKLILIGTFIFGFGCSKDDNSEASVSEKLIGKWNVVKDGDIIYDEICSYFIFQEDGKLIFKNCHSYGGETNIIGEYALINDNHILFIDYNYFLDDAEADILTITQNNLTLKFSNATNYTRVMELEKD